nr:CotH kinase family protein [Saprospiraceae bacterium]
FLLVVLTFVFILTNCKKEPLDIDGDNTSNPGRLSVDIGNSVIPYLVIDTKNTAINYEPKSAAVLEIHEKGTEIKKYNIGIEYRGKTSFRISDKKPYGIEIWDEAGNDIKASMLGFPEEADWILNNHVVNLKEKYIWDRSLMYNYIGYELARSAGIYASRSKFVELQINKEYLGVYVFMERLKRDKNRIDIKSLNQTSTNITGGYIIKIDKMSSPPSAVGKPLSYFLTNWDDDARYTSENSFRSRYDINGQLLTNTPFGPPYHANLFKETYFNYEYPKPENITAQQKSYIQNYVDQFETALASDDVANGQRTYANFIDINSFVDYFLLNELYRNVDAFRLSTFITKDRDEKLKMGPIWDLNIGFDEGGRIPMNDWIVNYNKHVT